MSIRALRTRLRSEAIVLSSCLAAAAALAGCGGSSANSTGSRVDATTCGVPYTFTVGGHEVPSGSCAGQMPGHHPPHVEVHPGERFSVLVTGNRNGTHVTRAFPVPKPTNAAVVITGVHGQTVHYQARATGTTRLRVRSQFCPSNPKVSTCSVLAVSVGPTGRNTGTVIGTIAFVGGPVATPGRPRPAQAGTVSVFTRSGKLVARQHVRAKHGFRFTLPPGRYELNAGTALYSKFGCTPQAVTVRTGRTTHAKVRASCDIP